MCDIVSFFEKAAWVLTKAGVDNPHSSSSLEKLKQQHIKENRYNKSSKVLKNLIKKLKSIPVVITKADKECKLVALNKKDYLEGLMKVLSDSSKFAKYKPPPKGRGRPSTMNVFERKTKEVNEYVLSIENLSDYVKCDLATRQPYLYGLAKTHKNKVPIPLRPVLSATGCYNFSLAKFITSLIGPFCYSSFCCQNADEFKDRLTDFRNNLPQDAEITCVSYDVESLFTNIPLDDTIDKLVSKIFKNDDTYKFKDVIFTKETLKEGLILCAKDQLFLFNNEVWLQIDGNSMGSPLGPPLANFYVSYIEEECINFNCDYSPKFYTRYVDDVFSVFINHDKSDDFLTHLNQVSTPLRFTIEKMENNKLNYIGLTIASDLHVSIIDKTPLYNFSSPSSHVPIQYLYAGINCLSFRALSYTDHDINLKFEFDKIKKSAQEAGLNKSKVEKILKDKVNSFESKSDNKSSCDNSCDSVDSKKFVLLPFINSKLANEVKCFFHNNDVKVSFSTGRNLYSLVRPRELSIEGKYLEANVVYKYKCNSCDRDYIGYTARPLNVRVSEHTNKSSCLSKAHSSFKCDSDINKSSFSILCKGSSVFDLRVKEAFFISNLKPSLNTKYESIKQNSAS